MVAFVRNSNFIIASYAKGKLNPVISNAKMKDEDNSIDLQWNLQRHLFCCLLRIYIVNNSN
jgi:hypothetical protein